MSAAKDARVSARMMDEQNGARNADSAAWTVGPMGQKLTRATMPPLTTWRWTPFQKADVVAGVRGGLLTLDEAMADYGLSLEEFASWERAVARFGTPGLRATHIQTHRAIEDKEQRALRLVSRRQAAG